jgi:plastocyanin
MLIFPYSNYAKSDIQPEKKTISISIVSGDYNPLVQKIFYDMAQTCGTNLSPAYYHCGKAYLNQLDQVNAIAEDYTIAAAAGIPYNSAIPQAAISPSLGLGYNSAIPQAAISPSLANQYNDLSSLANQYNDLSSLANQYNDLLGQHPSGSSNFAVNEFTQIDQAIDASSLLLGGHNLGKPPSFDPSFVTVRLGTTVEWTNHDNKLHSVTSGNPGSPTFQFDSDDLDTGQSFKYVFDKLGTFDYYDQMDQNMTGSIIVIK